MNMIFHAAYLDRRTIELFGNAAKIRMERIPRGLVAQQRATFFGGKDEMNVNGRKRLWHGARMFKPLSFANPKGITASSPRLARQRLPWV
jgi:hypothetical protein